MHGSYLFRGRSFVQESIDSIPMQNGFEEILDFREHLINIDCQLDFQAGTLFYSFWSEASQGLKMRRINCCRRCL